MKTTVLALAIILAFGFSGLAPAQAGKIVVAHDEWTLSNSGFSDPNDPGVFAANVADWFTGGSSGSFHAYSTNFGLTGSSLAAAMTAAGHTWTTGTGISFTLANLLTYDGIFLGGNTADTAVLISYVEAGGNVYLMGGTGNGSDWTWNPFLNHFGLQYASSYNGVGGSMEISSPHPIFAGVDHLYQNNGQDITDLLPADPRNQVLISYNGHGLYAVYASTVPLPASVWLLGSALVGLIGVRRRFTR